LSFFDGGDVQVGSDVKTGENYGFLETRDYDIVAPSESVTKAIISFPVTVDRNTSATRVNEAG
jgi:hypothetical protein